MKFKLTKTAGNFVCSEKIRPLIFLSSLFFSSFFGFGQGIWAYDSFFGLGNWIQINNNRDPNVRDYEKLMIYIKDGEKWELAKNLILENKNLNLEEAFKITIANCFNMDNNPEILKEKNK